MSNKVLRAAHASLKFAHVRKVERAKLLLMTMVENDVTKAYTAFPNTLENS